MHYWVYDKDVENASNSFSKTPQIIGFLGRTYGYPYPWAASQLESRIEIASVRAMLKQSAEKDAFWTVRRTAVEILGKQKDTTEIAFFRERCLDENSKVRVAALRALGNFKQPELTEFSQERFTKDDSYLAQAESIRFLEEARIQ